MQFGGAFSWALVTSWVWTEFQWQAKSSSVAGCLCLDIFHLLKKMFYFPLCVLQGIYHYWTYFYIFSRGGRLGGTPSPPKKKKKGEFQWQALSLSGRSEAQVSAAAARLPRTAAWMFCLFCLEQRRLYMALVHFALGP